MHFDDKVRSIQIYQPWVHVLKRNSIIEYKIILLSCYYHIIYTNCNIDYQPKHMMEWRVEQILLIAAQMAS